MIEIQPVGSPVSTYRTLPISSIKIPEGRRPLNDLKVQEIAESLPTIGLLNPITVSSENVLIAGLHRLEAFKRIGLPEIPVIVFEYDEIHQHLAEVLENSARSDLTELERGEALLEAKEFYEVLHPETKAGGDRGNQHTGGKTRRAHSATFATAKAGTTRRSERVIQESIQIAHGITSEVRDLIRGDALADRKKDLLNLARIKDPVKQLEVARQVVDGAAKDIHTAHLNVNRAEKLEALAEPADLSTVSGIYNVILADPPWRYEHVSRNSNAIENHYPTMTLAEIAALPIPAADTSILYLWATAPKLEEALRVMREWGFTYRSHAVWDKMRIGLGYWFRGRHELLLVGIKGEFPTPANETRFDSVFTESKTEHSVKPEIVYEMIEAMYPKGRKLEIFARGEARSGWAVWGNETQKKEVGL